MSMMFLAVAGLMVPALFHFTSRYAEHEISLQIAAILLIVYGLSWSIRCSHTVSCLISLSRGAGGAKTHSWKMALGFLAARDRGPGNDERDPHRALEPATEHSGSMRFSPASSCWPRSATSPA